MSSSEEETVEGCSRNDGITENRAPIAIAFVTRQKDAAAYEALYSEHVVMQENTSPPTVGKALNRERQIAL